MKIKVTITGWTEVDNKIVADEIKNELGIDSDDENVLFSHLAELMNSVENRKKIADILNADHIESIKARIMKR